MLQYFTGTYVYHLTINLLKNCLDKTGHYNSSGVSSGVRKLNGSYNINFASGTTYTGKGGLYRSTVSASTKAKQYNDRVTSISWTPSSSIKNAYIAEYNAMKRTGVRNDNTYNRIWSPGRSILQSVWSKLFGR